MSNKTVIECKGLGRSYGKVKAISDLDLAIAPGERVALIGPNGSGKSTLIKLFATLIRPTAGDLRLFDEGVSSDGARARQNTGVLLHEPLLYSRLTGRENLQFYARMFGVSSSSERIEELAHAMGVSSLLDDRVAALSHGQRKRIAIIRALLHEPALLLLDEPDSGLDQEAVKLLFRLVHRKERTVVMSTHNFENGLQMAERVVILRRGRLVMDCRRGSLDRYELEKRYLGAMGA